MLTLSAKRRYKDCDGSTRRDFLRIGGLGTLGLPGLLASRAHAAESGRPKKQTSVVWL